MTLYSFSVPGAECLPAHANRAMKQKIELEAKNYAHDHKEMREAVIRLAPRLAISQAVIDCGDLQVNDVLTEIDRVRLTS